MCTCMCMHTRQELMAAKILAMTRHEQIIDLERLIQSLSRTTGAATPVRIGMCIGLCIDMCMRIDTRTAGAATPERIDVCMYTYHRCRGASYVHVLLQG